MAKSFWKKLTLIPVLILPIVTMGNDGCAPTSSVKLKGMTIVRDNGATPESTIAEAYNYVLHQEVKSFSLMLTGEAEKLYANDPAVNHLNDKLTSFETVQLGEKKMINEDDAEIIVVGKNTNQPGVPLLKITVHCSDSYMHDSIDAVSTAVHECHISKINEF